VRVCVCVCVCVCVRVCVCAYVQERAYVRVHSRFGCAIMRMYMYMLQRCRNMRTFEYVCTGISCTWSQQGRHVSVWIHV